MVKSPTIEAPSKGLLAAETLPLAAWRSLGIPSLPAKKKAREAHLRDRLLELMKMFPLKVARNPSHDELQALVSGLAGTAILSEQSDGYVAIGQPPIEHDGVIVEGFIVNPRNKYGQSEKDSVIRAQIPLTTPGTVSKTFPMAAEDKRKLKLKPINEPGLWRCDRWKWEEAGEIQVVGIHNVPHEAVSQVAEAIRSMLQEFNLPLRVLVGQESTLGKDILQCINETRIGKQLDNQVLVTRLNHERVQSEHLRSGLVILLDPNEFDEFRRPGENQPGVFGTTADDGVSLLRSYHEKAVRHEFAHMLGLGPHCNNAGCVMRWECPSPMFCPLCVQKLGSICKIQSE